MEMTIKEQEIIETIRKVKENCPNEKIIFSVVYEPLVEGWLQIIRVANPLPTTAMRTEMKQMLNKIKKELAYQQALFTIFYDGGILGFFRAVAVEDFLSDDL